MTKNIKDSTKAFYEINNNVSCVVVHTIMYIILCIISCTGTLLLEDLHRKYQVWRNMYLQLSSSSQNTRPIHIAPINPKTCS